MKAPVRWLGEFIDVEQIGVERLASALTMAGLEVEEIDDSLIGPVFVTKVTPNRGDWMSLQGVAREAAAALARDGGTPLRLSRLGRGPLPSDPLPTPIRIEIPDWCPRYAAMIVEIAQPGVSPAWMQERLLAAGMRPINTVVDVTNYVMLELGQPLHAFDLDTMSGPEIIVRPARDGERLVTLDGKERILSPQIMVIADRERASAIAGIMGGQDSEVTERTRRVLIESAHFDASVVRAGAKALGMSTDASYRFERHVDPNGVPQALLAAAQLMAELTGGEVVDAATDEYVRPIAPRAVSFRAGRARDILGVALEDQRPFDALRVMGFDWKPSHRDGYDLDVLVPTHRPDITLEIDVIEELGRMIGYDSLPETLPPARSDHGGRDSAEGRLAGRVRAILIGQGLTEIYSHTLSAPSAFDDPAVEGSRIRIRTALSAELSGLRQSLVPGLLDTLGRNARLRNPDIRLFEIGKVFSVDADGRYREHQRASVAMTGDYVEAKGVLENLFAALGAALPQVTAHPQAGMHPNRSAALTMNGTRAGFVAEADPDMLAENLDLPSGCGRVACFEIDMDMLAPMLPRAASYFPLPRFPEVSRDLAMVFDLSVPYGEIERVARDSAGEYLESITLVSIYTGERIEAGRKSVALRFILRAAERTLVDADADNALAAVQAALTERLGALAR